MGKEFVPYEQSLALKNLGFNEECLSHYVKGNEYKDWTLYQEGGTFFASDYPEHIVAPLYQQAFRWFREKHDLVVCQERDGGWWLFTVKDVSTEDDEGALEIKELNVSRDTYEDAELACLQNLIEIVKEKQDG